MYTKRDLEHIKKLISRTIDNYISDDFETLAWLFEKYTEIKLELKDVK